MSRSSADATSGCTLELGHHVDEGVDAAPVGADAVPAREEPSERGGVDWLDLLAEGGEGTAPELPEDVVVAPLALDAVGPELAADDAALRPRAAPGPGARGSAARP